MMPMDIPKELRRHLLKPLVRRPRMITSDELAMAAQRLDQKAANDELGRRLADSTKADVDPKTSRNDPAAVKKWVKLTRALYGSGKLSRAEFVFYASSRAEGLAESRLMGEEYEHLVQPIFKRMREVEEEWDWDPDDPTNGDPPEEYAKLDARFSEISQSCERQTFQEVGLQDLLDLQQSHPREFERLRERGRRAVFHPDETIAALRDVVVRYENDARVAAEAGAYAAGVTLLGAALEGLLAIRALCSPKKAERIAQQLPKRIRPRKGEEIVRWRFECLIEVCLRAGWLPPVSTSLVTWDSAALAHHIRQLRNLVHPGRVARERPWTPIGREQFEEAMALYTILLAIIRGRLQRM